MTSTFECHPGIVPRLLGCDDCESWSCALTSILVILAAIGLALVFLSAYLAFVRPSTSSKVKRR